MGIKGGIFWSKEVKRIWAGPELSSQLPTDRQIMMTIATSIVEVEAVPFSVVGEHFIYFSYTAIKNSSKPRSG